MKLYLTLIAATYLTGCSVFGQSNVDTVPFTLEKSDQTQKIEVRNYDSMVLVSTNMTDDSANSAFRKLFNYIGGANLGATEISMTAPVIMDTSTESAQGVEIAMTAPVLMGADTDISTMSFVMPSTFTLATTPKPTDPDIRVSERKNYKVATIQFSGTLSDSNVKEHTAILSQWVLDNGYEAISESVTASYNGPFTLPMLRRNEIFIEVK